MDISGPDVIPHIIRQHAEESAFLWILRDAAVDAPHYVLEDLSRLTSMACASLGRPVGGLR
jgi:hypothetical protein